MKIKYSIVDKEGKPVVLKMDDMYGYDLNNVSEYKCYQFASKEIAENELDNICRILRNDDYYNVCVSSTVILPLRISGVESFVRFFEI